ncbi:zinc finger MYM-type protein 1-like protein [Tanacetum coccineum]
MSLSTALAYPKISQIHKDGDGDALFQLKSDSLPHAHAQTTKTYYKHRDSRIMKAQELKTKTSAQTLIYKIFLQRYQVYQGRLLASFQDDAKYEHVGQDTRSQGSDKINVDKMNIDNRNPHVRNVDIFDPRNWDGLTSDMIKDCFFTRVTPNNEKCDRECTRLKEHEVGLEHITNMVTWFEMRRKLRKNETIDKVAHEQFEKERDHWMKVLLRIISIVKFLNLAFRGTNRKLHVHNNGNFLGLIEILEEFDPFIKEHVRRITSNEIHVHYLGHSIQNELIQLLAIGIRSQIIKKIKQAKYFSVIFDCTPDTSHQEQMSLILRYVNVSSTCVTIEESFLGFLNVNDTTGQGLFDVTQDELKALDLDIDDRWLVLKGNVKGLNLNSLSTTHWESRVESVKAIRYQLSEIREALLQVAETDNDSKIKSESTSLATNELNVAIKEVGGLISFFEEFRDIGFDKAINVAKDIAIEMDIDPVFRQKRVIRRKRQFDEEAVNQDTSFFVE